MRVPARGVAVGAALLLTGSVAGAQHAQATSLEDCLTLREEAEIRACAQEALKGCPLPIAASSPWPDLQNCLQENAKRRVGRYDVRADANADAACRVRDEEYQREQAKEKLEASRSCAERISDSVTRRINADATCIEQVKPSVCFALSEVSAAKACFGRCLDAREKFLHDTVRGEQRSCEGRYVDADGHGRFACAFAGAVPGVDAGKLLAATKTAMQANDGATLDVAIRQSEGQFLYEAQGDCTKACNDRAPQLLAAKKQSTALVTAYKRCMVAADSTPEARKLDAYEVDLYCDYLHKADGRCRAASRCDWLEGLSDATCTYASPGVDRCQ